MTKFQLGLLIGFFLGALVIFVTLGIIQLYLAEQHDRKRRRNRAALGPSDAAQSTSYLAPLAQSGRASEPHSLMAIKMTGEEEERIIYLFVLIE